MEVCSTKHSPIKNVWHCTTLLNCCILWSLFVMTGSMQTYHKFAHIPLAYWSGCHCPHNHHRQIPHTDQKWHCGRTEGRHHRRDPGLAPGSKLHQGRHIQPLEDKEWSRTDHEPGWVCRADHPYSHHWQCHRMARRKVFRYQDQPYRQSLEDSPPKYRDLIEWSEGVIYSRVCMEEGVVC